MKRKKKRTYCMHNDPSWCDERCYKKHKPPRKCKCGHKWEDHHHGCVMNPKIPVCDHKQGICSSLLAQECEATRVNGEWLVSEKKRCYCRGYR